VGAVAEARYTAVYRVFRVYGSSGRLTDNSKLADFPQNL